MIVLTNYPNPRSPIMSDVKDMYPTHYVHNSTTSSVLSVAKFRNQGMDVMVRSCLLAVGSCCRGTVGEQLSHPLVVLQVRGTYSGRRPPFKSPTISGFLGKGMCLARNRHHAIPQCSRRIIC
jgi:hypothetical protein